MREVKTQGLPGWSPRFLIRIQLLSLFLERLPQFFVRLLGPVGLLNVFLAHLLLVFLGGVPGLLLPAVDRGNALVTRQQHE